MFIFNRLHKYIVNYHNDDFEYMYKYYFKINLLTFQYEVDSIDDTYEYKETTHSYNTIYRCHYYGLHAFELIRQVNGITQTRITINPNLTDSDDELYFITIITGTTRNTYEIIDTKIYGIIRRFHEKCKDRYRKYHWWW